MTSKKFQSIFSVTGVLIFAQATVAHPGHGSANGFSTGAAHPFAGIDHVLAMVAVGMCAARMGGRAIWMLPVVFLGAMIVGGSLAIGGATVPMVEQGIAASVLILGLLIAAGSKLPMTPMLPLIGLFAIFHGYAHGSEMHTGMSPASYAGGFLLATAILHGIGVGAGLLLKRPAWNIVSKISGSAIAVFGGYLFFFGA